SAYISGDRTVSHRYGAGSGGARSPTEISMAPARYRTAMCLDIVRSDLHALTMAVCNCEYGVGRFVLLPFLWLCQTRKRARVNNSRHIPVHAIANRSRRKTMRKVTLTFGLLAGAIISVFMVIGMALWEKTLKINTSELIGYATMVVALSMIFFGI